MEQGLHGLSWTPRTVQLEGKNISLRFHSDVAPVGYRFRRK